MATKLGMNTELAVEVANSVAGLSTGLASVEDQLRLARLMSLNPLNYLLNPGASILAPASITIAASAAADIANARNMLDYLVLKLRQEAVQQNQVSNSLTPLDPGWFAQAPTAQRPEEIDLLDMFDPFRQVLTWTVRIRNLVDAGLQGLSKWWSKAPDWLKTGAKISGKAGKFVPFVGAPLGWVNVAADWDDDNAWGNTRNIIGATLGTAEVICLIPPLTPAAPIVAGVGLAWDVFDTVWDIGDEFWW